MKKSPLDISRDEFRRIGYELIDSISEFLETIDQKKVTTSETALELQELLGNRHMPLEGMPVHEIVASATDLLLNHSLLNGHPKFFGYITASPSPVGALADLIAAAVNPNVGANILSPVATEIEKQTIEWLIELIGLPESYSGILVSGGNMANFTGFLAARTEKGPKNIREDGPGNGYRFTVYCPVTTHVWIEKACALFGPGTNLIRWISTDDKNRMNIELLEKTILEDFQKNFVPMMVVGNAGDVSTGAVDDLASIAGICKRYNIWFHVDGAYGLPAAVLPELKPLFSGVEQADSIAIDPHKWLYSPLEAGCTLVKDPAKLLHTFSFHPAYYNFDTDNGIPPLNYYEYGLQNSRGFRALKVWLTLKQAGINGYRKMIGDDIKHSELLFEIARSHPELEAITHALSITTLRYVTDERDEEYDDEYLNSLNEALLNELQRGGEVFLSNAVVKGKYCLRTCVVNFRVAEDDIRTLAEVIVREGRKLHSILKTQRVKETK